MAIRSLQSSPQPYARIGGAIYLIIIISGLLGEMFIRERLIVAGDALATLENIRASELLWRFGIAANLFHLACSVPLALILYRLLSPVNRHLALLAVMFNMVAISLEAVSKLFLLPSLFVLGNAPYLEVFSQDQLAALASLSNRSHAYGFNISLIFFGFECIVLGYLIFKSTFLPKTIGVLMQIAGICYLTNSFTLLLAPTFANVLILLPSFVAELSLALWLLIKGVATHKWRERLAAGLSANRMLPAGS
ncbi:MAG: DUF4386 domain-containing protein [Pseudomarimonas sp.]